MKKIALFIYVCVVFSIANAQKYTLESDVDFTINSNGITPAFTKALLSSNYIDSTIKNNAIDKLKPRNNRFMVNLSTELKFTKNEVKVFGKEKSNIYFITGSRIFSNMSFSKDVFRLVFEGNKTFAGQTVDLDNTYINSIWYQHIGLGLKVPLRKEFSFSGAISFLKGSNAFSLQASEGSLTTAADGSALDLSMQFQANYSATEKPNLLTFDGVGSKIDLGFEYKKDKINIVLEAKDLGLISWNKASYSFAKDSAVQYTGVNINDIFNLNTSNTAYNLEDTAFALLGLNEDRKSFSTWLPGRVNVKLKYKLSDFNQLEFKVEQYFGTQTIPEFILKDEIAIFKIEKEIAPHIMGVFSSLSIIPQISYGGFGNFNMGLALKADLPKQFKLFIQSKYLLGYFVHNNPYGKSVYVNLKKSF